jgi:formate dehydrogenase subunit gamma
MAIAADRSEELVPPEYPERVLRHAGIDRLFHWLTALSVLTLMATGLLPRIGVHFDWISIHWVAGLTLVALVTLHIVRALIWQHLRTIWVSLGELRSQQLGKYSVAQKLMHHAMTLMVLCAAVSGVLMLKKIRTPFFTSDPYIMSADAWGVTYVLHDLAALLAVTLVMIHVYFALIPENRMYLRAMIRGWVTRQEQRSRLQGTQPAAHKSP